MSLLGRKGVVVRHIDRAEQSTIEKFAHYGVATVHEAQGRKGLMAPHIARMMGFRRAMPHMLISALAGGVLLVFADWCGRMVLFPYQIPAGLLSTFIGAPYFIYLLRKQSR